MEYSRKELPGWMGRWGGYLLAIGVLVSGVGFAIDPSRSFFIYLVIFAFLLSIAVGSLFLVALEYLVNASWSTPVRRVSEFLAASLPWVGLVSIPLLVFGLHELYHWAHHASVEHDPILAGKSPYLNEKFFWARVIGTFVLWYIFYRFFVSNSQGQDTTRDQRLTKRNIQLAAVFIPLFAVSLSVAGFDWLMSLEPHWFSTMFGVYYFSGTVLSSLAALTLFTVYLGERGYLHPRMTRDTYYNLGGLMFAFTCFWGYIAFSQYMLIWYGNLPEETFWYITRWNGSWKWLTLFFMFFHFIIPFFALLPRTVKTRPRYLMVMAVWLLVAHLLDLYWIVMPVYNQSAATFGWTDIGFVLGAVGLVLTVFVRQARKINLVPVGDPKLERGLAFHL